MTCLVFAAALTAVNFVECPKCDKRVRISEDEREAFINLCRIDPSRKAEMAARAEKLLARARPVAPANPLTPLMGWSSWNTFALDISEETIVGVSRTMATNGLKAAGYVYVNIDDGFFDGHGEKLDEVRNRMMALIGKFRISAEVVVMPSAASGNIGQICKISSSSSLVFMGIRQPHTEESTDAYAAYVSSLRKGMAPLPQTVFACATEDIDFNGIFK